MIGCGHRKNIRDDWRARKRKFMVTSGQEGQQRLKHVAFRRKEERNVIVGEEGGQGSVEVVEGRGGWAGGGSFACWRL
jgi:hypothetical protein